MDSNVGAAPVLVAQMQKTAIRVAALAGLLMVGGFLFVWSGLYSVAASRGHWPITGWLLEFAMRNSVETHAGRPAEPRLDDPALVMRGAGHFQGGCAVCHGAPGVAPNAAAPHMLPPPPELSRHVASWSDDELFWIVKHGIKYTGMPAWPAPRRDDEVWAVVAFLRALPGLDAEAYRQLAIGEARVPPAAEDASLLALIGPIGGGPAACARCHGLNGAGRGTGAYPRIAGQSAEYLYDALRDFASGARPSGLMQIPASELSEAEMRKLADYYARQSPPFPEPPPVEDPAVLRRGEALATAGAPEQGVPACAACHGEAGLSANPLFPSLAGQYPSYIAQQLRLWRQGARGDTASSKIMAAVARKLDDAQIRAVSLYYGSIRPPAAGSAARSSRDSQAAKTPSPAAR